MNLLMFDAHLIFYITSRLTFYKLTMMYLGDVLMIHILDLIHQSHVSAHSIIILYEILFEIHNVFVWGFFCTVDVDVAEVAILGGFY